MTVTHAALRPPPKVGLPALAGWVLFDFAAQPFYTLLTTFIFAPFFANHLAADPVGGQAIWGYGVSIAGLVIALLAPVLGAIADAAGRRKPWIAFFSVLLCVGAWMLWHAVPGAGNAIAIALVGYFIASIGAEFATVFTNAMMPGLVPEQRLGRLSGIGWATGYVGGLLTLIIALGLLVPSGNTGLTFFGVQPIFGLDPATHEGDRASGPLTALWYLVFVLPLFLFTPDAPRMLAIGPAVRRGLANLKRTAGQVRQQSNIFRFLVGHMIYADGLAAVFVFGGIYGSTTFGWTTLELGLFGILATITGIAGGLVGGWLDDRIGAKRVILGSIVILSLASIGIVSIDRDHVLFAVSVVPASANDGLFATAGEKLYMAMGALIGLIAAPLQSASRTMVVRIAPRDRITEIFGLYALAGKLTTFVGPLAVGLVTQFFASQRVGISVLLLFFLVGGWLVTGVRPGRA